MLFPIPILYFTANTHAQNVAIVILVSEASDLYAERHDLVNCREVHRGWNILPAGTEFLRRIHVNSCVSGSLSVETRPRGCAAEVVVVVIRFGKHWVESHSHGARRYCGQNINIRSWRRPQVCFKNSNGPARRLSAIRVERGGGRRMGSRTSCNWAGREVEIRVFSVYASDEEN